MKTFQHLFLCSFALIAMSCSSMKTYKLVNRVIPPPYELPEQTQQLIVLNAMPELRKTVSNNYSTNYTSTQPQPEDENRIHARYQADRMYYKLNQGKYYLVKRGNLMQNHHPWQDPFAVQYMGEKDVLVVLDDFVSDYDFKSEKIRKHQLDAQGRDYYIEAYESSRNYRVRAYWSLYNGADGQLLDRFEEVGEKKFSTQGLHKDQTILKLDSLGQGIPNYLMDSLATSFANYILPVRVYDSWTYFAKGDPVLETGQKYMSLDQLEKAEETYRRGLSSADDKTKPKLYYNLAVINDIRRSYGAALDYAEKAVLLSDKSTYTALYNKIKLKLEISQR